MKQKRENKKIRVVYPDGRVECNDNVSETFRNAIAYMGLERVRALNERYNSINIVSTPGEAETSTGKPESKSITITDVAGKEYIACTQFATAAKYRKLQKINDALHAGLKISLVSPEIVAENQDVAELTPDIMEGLAKEYRLTLYERNPRARKLCIEHHGNVCQICGFDFEKTYGKRDGVEPYIEVHHLNPHAEVSADGEHSIDYKRDLIPVCANCHRMLHHLKDHLITPQELKEIVSGSLKEEDHWLQDFKGFTFKFFGKDRIGIVVNILFTFDNLTKLSSDRTILSGTVSYNNQSISGDSIVIIFDKGQVKYHERGSRYQYSLEIDRRTKTQWDALLQQLQMALNARK